MLLIIIVTQQHADQRKITLKGLSLIRIMFFTPELTTYCLKVQFVSQFEMAGHKHCH